LPLSKREAAPNFKFMKIRYFLGMKRIIPANFQTEVDLDRRFKTDIGPRNPRKRLTSCN
jgi:hypothetical protein